MADSPNNETLIFRSGGKRGTIITGIVISCAGCIILWASLFGESAEQKNAWVGTIIGPGMILAGLGIITWRSGNSFDPASRRWHHSWRIYGFGGKRDGDFSEIEEIDITREVSEHDGNYTTRFPVYVKVRGKASILVDYFPSEAASYEVGQKLSALVGVPLADHYNEPRDLRISMDAIPDLPEPPNKLVTYTVEGKAVTFIVPPGTKQEALGCSALILACTAIAVLVLFKVIVRSEEYRIGEYIAVAIMGIPLALAGLYAISVILVKAFLMTESVRVSPEGLLWSARVGPWRKMVRIPANDIKDVQLLAEKDGRPKSVVVVGTKDSVTFGRGLPPDEKVWLASVVRTILGRKQ